MDWFSVPTQVFSDPPPSLSDLKRLWDSVKGLRAEPRTMLVIPRGTKLPTTVSDGISAIGGIEIVESEFINKPVVVPLPEPRFDFWNQKIEPIFDPYVERIRFRSHCDFPIFSLPSIGSFDVGPVYVPTRRDMRFIYRRRREKKLKKRCLRILGLFGAGKLKNKKALRRPANLLERFGHHERASIVRGWQWRG